MYNLDGVCNLLRWITWGVCLYLSAMELFVLFFICNNWFAYSKLLTNGYSPVYVCHAVFWIPTIVVYLHFAPVNKLSHIFTFYLLVNWPVKSHLSICKGRTPCSATTYILSWANIFQNVHVRFNENNVHVWVWESQLTRFPLHEDPVSVKCDGSGRGRGACTGSRACSLSLWDKHCALRSPARHTFLFLSLLD
jgi:hypothetical protein